MSKRGPRVAGAVILFAVVFLSLLVARRSQTPVVPDNIADLRPTPAVGVRRPLDGSGFPLHIIPEGSPLHDGAGVEVASRDVLVESRGSYSYHGDSYSISLDADSVRWQSDSAELNLRFHEASLGDTVLSKGGKGAPLPLPLERTVTYDRGIVKERYLFRQEGVEQSFVLSQAPSGGGDLTVATSISSDLTPPAEGTVSRRLSFSRDGREVAFITRAEAFDHRGRSLPLELSWKEGTASMTVPSAWLAEAEFPVTVDPIIGSPTTIRSTTAAFKGSDVAYNSVANEWLAVWSEPSATLGSDIWTQRVAASGSLVGTPVNLGVAGYTHSLPTVSYCTKVNRYLVTWSAAANFVSPSLYRIYGAVLNSDGSVNVPTFTVKQLGANAIDILRVACDDTNWFVCWGQRTTSIYPPQFTIGGNFISTSGVPGAYVSVDADPYPSGQSTPTVAFMNGTYVLSWIKNGQLVARSMNPSGGFMPITVVDAGSDSAPNITASSGQGFLLTWTSAVQSSTGRQYSLNAKVLNATLGSTNGMFSLRTSLPSAPSAAASVFSAVDGVWYTAYSYDQLGTGKTQILIQSVSPAGSAAIYETLSDGSATATGPRVAWNSAADTTLVTYASAGSAGNTLVGLRTGRSGLPPSAPTGLVATPGDSHVNLKWTPVSGATGYTVYRSTTSGGPYDAIGSVTTASYPNDLRLFNGTPYYYVVNAFNFAGPGPTSTEVVCTPRLGTAPQALFVAGAVPPGSDDAAIINELQNVLGYSVVVHADTGILSSDITGKALAVISSTVNADNVSSAFFGATVPVLVSSPGMMQNYLSMTSSSGSTAGQSVVVMNPVNASHPMSAGLTGSPQIVGTAATFSWGIPYGTATVIATLSGNSSEAAVFAYDAGVTMSPGNLAPARRVGFFLGIGAGPALNTAGHALLDAAVRYTAGVPDAPSSVTVQAEKGMATLEWTDSPGATSYRIYRSTSRNGPFTLIASGVSGTTYVDTGLAVGQTYYYTLAAVNDAGTSQQGPPWSAPVTPNTAVVDIGGTVSIVPYSPSFPSPYNSGSVDAFVAKSVNSLLQSLSADGTTIASGRWSIAGPVTITGQTSTHCDFTTTSQKEGSCSVSYTVTLSTGETTTKTCTVKIRYLKPVRVKFHFPEDSPGRTTRGGYGDFWAPDDPTVTPKYLARYQNRTDFVNHFVPLVNSYWQHAGISVAPYVDEKLMGVIGCTGGTFNVADSRGETSSQGTAAWTKYRDDLTTVHVFLVNSIQGGRYLGDTLSGPLDSGWAISIFLSDSDTTGETFAHELGHALGLPDYKDRLGRDIRGIINNHTKTWPWNPLDPRNFGPLDFLLMKWQAPSGPWVTDSDGWGARAAADTRKVNYN